LILLKHLKLEQNMKTKVMTVIVGSLICLSSVYATIINIPDDQTTIQAGIDASVNGDTVLVQPGLYVENINFNGHCIVLGSLFLTTGDASYISNTIIDGDSAGSVITLVNYEHHTYVFGFTIQYGYSTYMGGGILVEYSDPIISNNIIINNKVLAEINGNGGGIACNYSNAIIQYNSISFNNVSNCGGGIYCKSSNATIKGNNIKNNDGPEAGGGICCVTHNPIIIDNYIANNVASYIYDASGGGIYYIGFDNPIISNNTIKGNIAQLGAGMYLKLILHPTVSNNIIYENIASNRGGGIWGGGDEYMNYKNNIIFNNEAYFGGGLYCSNICQFTNNIIRNNSAFDTTDQISFDLGGDTIFNYCNIEGGWEGEGNIDCDPMFCNPAEDDFHVADVSCCLGAGEGGVDIGALGVGCYAIEYLAGDANMYGGTWPPAATGPDVTYLVNYFRSLPTSHTCLLNGLWASADANGDCNVIGSDVTKLVNVFRGIGSIGYCPSYPPMWLTSGDLPEEAPEGWPGCE
jgi:hypothetical protein